AGRHPWAPLAPRHVSRGVGASLLPFPLRPRERSLGDPGPAADDRSPAPAALTVSVSETSDAVRLRILASGDIEPGSVEVRFAGRKAMVRARDLQGRAVRSRSVRLPAPVVEEGASADYDAEDALVMTLRKQTAQAAAPSGNPEAAAR